MTTATEGRPRLPRRLDRPRAGAGRHLRRPSSPSCARSLSVVLAGLAAQQESLTLLVVALVVYWAGDSLDGFVARIRGCETRIGAVLDILCDRFCAAAFYLGLVWLQPRLRASRCSSTSPSSWSSTASCRWRSWPGRCAAPTTSTSIDRPLWLWNWSKPGKAVNSSLFAVLLLVTGWVWLGALIATGAAGDEVASPWCGWAGSGCRSRPLGTVGVPAMSLAPLVVDRRRSRQRRGSTPYIVGGGCPAAPGLLRGRAARLRRRTRPLLSSVADGDDA